MAKARGSAPVVVYVRTDKGPNGPAPVLAHDCEQVGEVQLSQDWRFCPWCGRGLTMAIRRSSGILERERIEAERQARAGSW